MTTSKNYNVVKITDTTLKTKDIKTKSGTILYSIIEPDEINKLMAEGAEILGEVDIHDKSDMNDCSILNLTLKNGTKHLYIKPINSGIIKAERYEGFVYVGDNKYVAIVKHNIGIPVLQILGLCLAVIFVALTLLPKSNVSKPNTETTSQKPLEIESGIDWDGQMSNVPEETVPQETITIPGYSNLYVSEANKTIRLVNPEENTVYLQYVLKYEDTIVYETKAIAPGKMIEANLYDVLELGEYNLTMQINTYDINTETACNGAIQSITLLVK